MSNLEKAINKLKLGKITGKVWATIKDEKLQGTILYLMQPMDENLNPVGKEVVAVDTVGSREDDIVYWVGAAEATFVFDDRQIPSDVSIVGLVDRLDLTKRN
ncbi:MAG: EutN/CcmL family microcompartment protein [Ignavibacteriales bacterium]|nr:EutN/CcmL family microcompartment protein [Ignavibacteriales bacterium]